jgi:hypothetical protein
LNVRKKARKESRKNEWEDMKKGKEIRKKREN